MDIDQPTPAQVLRARYVLEDRLVSPGSTSGLIAERARLGLATHGEGYQGDGQASTRAELADLLLLTRDLTPLEQRCCRLRYGATAGSATYERLVRIGDLREGDGEEVIDVRPVDLDGNPLGGEWVRVRGRRARMPSYSEIAAHLAAEGVCNADGLPMSAGAVERRLRDASEKVATAIRARRAMTDWEDRAAG